MKIVELPGQALGETGVIARQGNEAFASGMP
jgi:hypothetical protein